MTERKPYPFFASVEFLTVLVKVGTTSTPFLIAIAASGFTLPNLLALLFSGIVQGCLLAAQEMKIHQNLYTNKGWVGRDKEDAIANIQHNVAAEIALNTDQTINEVLESTTIRDVTDFVVKPDLGKAASRLVGNLLKGIF